MHTMTFEEIESLGHQVIPDLEDPRDYKIEEILGAVTPPETFSIRDKQTPVRYQGARGTCVGHSVVAVAEYFDGEVDLSEEFLFKFIKKIDWDDYFYDGYGAYLRSGAKALTQYGACLEDTLPYNLKGSEDSWKSVVISPAMKLEAEEFRTVSYARVDKTPEAYKQALFQTKAPILFGVSLYESYRQSQSTGVFPIPKKDEKIIGAHAMAMVGYDADGLWAKNSWGTGWGDKGYVYLPWGYMPHMFNGWSFVDLVIEDTIESNKRLVSPWALDSWNKAIKKGLVVPETKPKEGLNTERYFVFEDRAGRL